MAIQSMNYYLPIVASLLSALIGSGTTAFFYQRKLKLLEYNSDAIKEIRKRFLKGVSDLTELIAVGRELNRQLKQALSQNSFNERNLRDIESKFRNTTQSLRKKISVHRVYLAEIIPYGESSELQQCDNIVLGYIELLLSRQPSEQSDELRKGCRMASDKLDECYSDLQAAISRALRSLEAP